MQNEGAVTKNRKKKEAATDSSDERRDGVPLESRVREEF